MTRVAALDCGTNSLRLLVADVTHDAIGAGVRVADVAREMRIVRLGADVDRTGRLDPDAIERTRVALVEQVATARAAGAERIRMVATSATRDAANRDEFVTMVRGVLGVDPEVVSGDEEARLSFRGATADVPADLAAPYLVLDIGGGSTEFVLGERAVLAARSVDVGCVRLTERHLHDDPPTAAQIRAAEADAVDAVARAAEVVPLHEARTLLGLAGSVTTVAALAMNLAEYDAGRIHHARIGRDAVAEISARLLTMTRGERAALGPMHPGRVDVIGAGALVLRVVLDEVGLDVVAGEHDILDGIAVELAAGD